MIKINLKEKALINCDTAEVLRPHCWDSLIPYHSYLVGRRRFLAAASLLEEVFKGEKVISKMIENSQKHSIDYKP